MYIYIYIFTDIDVDQSGIWVPKLRAPKIDKKFPNNYIIVPYTEYITNLRTITFKIKTLDLYPTTCFQR